MLSAHLNYSTSSWYTPGAYKWKYCDLVKKNFQVYILHLKIKNKHTRQ